MNTGNTDLILCSEAVTAAVQKGLSVKSAVEAFRKAINNTTFAVWGRRHVTVYATPETLAREWNDPNDRFHPLEVQHVPYWEFPESDEDGFAVIADEHGDITVATGWLQDTLLFQGTCPAGPCCVRLWNICFSELAVRRIIAAHAPDTRGRAGRRPRHDYKKCEADVLAEIMLSPAQFIGEDGRVRQNSSRNQQRSVIEAARKWCERDNPDAEPPSDDTLRRKVAEPIASKLTERGLRIWKC